jgi:hypothetical protein
MPNHNEIQAEMRFADPDRPAGVLYARALDSSTNNFVYEDVRVQNARRSAERFSLETTGFELVVWPTEVTDFGSAEQVDGIYKPEMVTLLKERTGARRVVVFQAQGRWEDGEKRGLRQTAGNAHMDYTADSFRLLVRQALGDEEADAEMAAGRWGIINVWRGMKPVERRPLALCDARTLNFANGFVDVPIHLMPGQETPYQGRNMIYAPECRWFYFPQMQPEEALVFRQFDSESSIKAAPHSAIDDPTSPANARQRESFEIRAVVFY